MPEKRGRPTKHTPEIAQEICDKLKDGQSLRSICKAEHLPTEAAVRQWAYNDMFGFSTQYAEAREAGYIKMADDLLDIADDDEADVQRSRLRVDTRKWLLSKALPKVYGEKVIQEHTGKDGADLIPDDTRQIARAVLAIIQRAQLDELPVINGEAENVDA